MTYLEGVKPLRLAHLIVIEIDSGYHPNHKKNRSSNQCQTALSLSKLKIFMTVGKLCKIATI